MPTYAVEIGKIVLQAERPITMQDRERVKEWIESGRVPIIYVEATDGTALYANLQTER